MYSGKFLNRQSFVMEVEYKNLPKFWHCCTWNKCKKLTSMNSKFWTTFSVTFGNTSTTHAQNGPYFNFWSNFIPKFEIPVGYLLWLHLDCTCAKTYAYFEQKTPLVMHNLRIWRLVDMWIKLLMKTPKGTSLHHCASHEPLGISFYSRGPA